jgi:hypothetical protein
VRAALDIVDAVSRLKTHAPLQTRVGIATGLVVVGDLIGSGASQEQSIVGETPNLAARLQGVAEPNTVVIAESTRKLVGNVSLGLLDVSDRYFSVFRSFIRRQDKNPNRRGTCAGGLRTAAGSGDCLAASAQSKARAVRLLRRDRGLTLRWGAWRGAG